MKKELRNSKIKQEQQKLTKLKKKGKKESSPLCFIMLIIIELL